jgi:hypothetical protein
MIVGMGFYTAEDTGQRATDIDRDLVSGRCELGKPRIDALVRGHYAIERNTALCAGNQVTLDHPAKRARAGFLQVTVQIGFAQTRHHSALP